jgi:hypothetical protein
MYSRAENYLKSNNISPELFIEGRDYTNSQLLYMIDNYDNWKYYLITKYERRPDLLALDIYGSPDYSWLLMYMNRCSINELKRGEELRFIEPSVLKNILSIL